MRGPSDVTAHPSPERAAGEPPGGSLGTATRGRPNSTAPVELRRLAQQLGMDTASPDVQVTGLTLDSRDVRPGDLFAAVPGANVHRATFALDAVAAGAVAVLTDPAGRSDATATGLPVLEVADPRAHLGSLAATVYGQPASKLMTLGVTGTNGKTTTAYLLDAGLRAAGHTTGLIGTIETRIGDRAVPSERTTPEAPDLQALLAVMVEQEVTAVAMEVSSHALDLGRVDGLVVDVALFTNLGTDHLDFHGDLDAYFQAKARLFTPAHSRAAVVNLDDAHGRLLVEQATVPVTTFSVRGDAAADWRVEHLAVAAGGSTYSVVAPDGLRVPATVRLPGRFNVDNAVGALVTLVTAGLAPEVAASGIARCDGVPGRMERVDAGQDFLAVVDYAHTPEAIETLLAALRPLTSERLLLVMGCGGDRDAAKRPAMGVIGASAADLLVVTDDNPRSEDPGAIRRAVLDGARTVRSEDRAEVLEVGNRAEAITAAVARARTGDVLVVAGKGHEPTQHVGAQMLPFDDRDVLRTALQAVLGTAPGAHQ